ncbi:MAG TPA: type 1 glutamine amidotransferase, partial [Spirochaetia bacterium]|nr:type 1 glutamine amidotransferase [Spirochaetia bacterium]
MGLRAHWLQHVPFEGLGSIEDRLERMGARVSSTRFFDRAELPNVRDLDLLIVMGGPMSVNDEAVHAWLKDEKQLIAKAIDAGKAVLGVCLGAQLIASALGARVYRNPEPEIGWFPVEKLDSVIAGSLPGLIPSRFDAFHWHGETFDLPSGALHVARSRACENQAFTLGDRVVAFQFHLETTEGAARALVGNCR